MMIHALILMVSLLNPSPYVAQCVIDVARIIGLPRLFTFDEYLSRQIVETGEMEPIVLVSYRGARRKFFTNYFKINSLKLNRE